MGQQVLITAPQATVSDPLEIVFTIDASQVPAGQDKNTIAILRDGVPVMACGGLAGEATPDPCVANRALLPDGDIELTVLSSSASTWDFVVEPPELLPGTRVSIRNKIPEDKEKNRGLWLVKDSSVSVGARGGPDDPRCNAEPAGTVKATIRFFSNASGSDTGAIALPCQNWAAIGPDDKPKGYRYLDKELDDGPCKLVRLRAGKWAKALCLGKGATTDFAYDLTEGTGQGTVNVVLTSGVIKYCTAFAPFKGRDGSDGKKFSGRHSISTASCPAPGSPSGAFLEMASSVLN